MSLLIQNDEKGEEIQRKLETLSAEEKCEFLRTNYGLNVSETNIQKIYQMRSLKSIREFKVSAQDSKLVEEGVKALLK